MKVEYSKRAVADLHKVSADSKAFGDMVAAAVEVRIRDVVAQLANYPKGRQQVVERPGVHVVALVRYPYKIFYRIGDDRVTILHIRNTSREQWGK
jgi:plasmid stabilization system protein ParE